MQGEQTVLQAAPRKQNIACDACRTRKVKCVMLPNQEKVRNSLRGQFSGLKLLFIWLHCQTKNYPCTFLVQRETSEKKRQGSVRRRTSDSTYQPGNLTAFYSSTFNALPSRTLSQPLDTVQSFITPPLPSSPPTYPETPTARLLTYLFSPEPPSHLYPESLRGYKALPDYQERHHVRLDDWGEVGVKLQDPAFRREFALDLVEVYFEICHTRNALLVPSRFRSQLLASLPPLSQAPPEATSPSALPQQSVVSPSILAAVLAWGAKFSEHPLIVEDRAADVSGTQRSRLARSLIKKAWEIAEAEKAHTFPTPDNVVACLLLDGLHSHHVNDPDGYRSFWLNCALRHLLHLQASLIINKRSADRSLVEPEQRHGLTYAWWIACLADAFSSLFFRRKPVLEDNDYDIDFYTPDDALIAQSGAEGPDSEKQLSAQAWYAATHTMARCAREMSRQLWRPCVHAEGIPFTVLLSLIREFNTWRIDHLEKVGVPGTQVNWDFLAAVAACGHDATYHIMWVILYQALREYGIREVNEAKRTGNGPTNPSLIAPFTNAEVEVQKEALNAASRIAGLADLLTQSGYLRLDPNVMHFSIYSAGKLLAEFGREEVLMCINGLQQYGVSYDDAFDQAAEIQRIYAASRIEPQPSPQVWDSNATAHNNVSASHHCDTM
ncbi:hypothetical protein BU17DRAFT_39547 [Hysterangium stoloniferum]|nr:hypothetical protein BU17DRAFT_39547 [Hysterangium stoloniferum]